MALAAALLVLVGSVLFVRGLLPMLQASSARVENGKSTTVSRDNVTVILPAGSAPEGAVLRLEPAPPPTGLSAAIQPVGPAIRVTLSAALTGRATVRFPKPATPSKQFVVVWEDGNGGWRWLPGAKDASGATISAETDHFSTGFLAAVNVDQLADAAGARVKAMFAAAGRANVTQPTCGDEAAARKDADVTSDGGDRVRWCFGVESGRRVLKVANNTLAFMQLTYPQDWRVELKGPLISVDAAIRVIAAKVAVPRGSKALVLSDGDTVSFFVPDGSIGTVTAEMSVIAWALQGAVFGGEIYLEMASAAGIAGADALDMSQLLLGLEGSKEALAKAPKACTEATSELSEDVDADAAQAAFWFAAKCGSQLAQAGLAGGGATTWFVASVVKMVAQAVSLVLTGGQLVLAGAREIWDSLASFGGRSDSIYDVRVKPRGEQPEATGSSANNKTNRLHWVITTDGLGPLELGSDASVGLALGVVRRDSTTDCPGKVSDTGILGSVHSFWSKKNRLTLLHIESSAFKTRSGIKVGDTVADLKRTYRGILKSETDQGDGTRQLVIRDPEDQYVEFLAWDGRIQSIAVGSGRPSNSGIDVCGPRSGGPGSDDNDEGDDPDGSVNGATGTTLHGRWTATSGSGTKTHEIYRRGDDLTSIEPGVAEERTRGDRTQYCNIRRCFVTTGDGNIRGNPYVEPKTYAKEVLISGLNQPGPPTYSDGEPFAGNAVRCAIGWNGALGGTDRLCYLKENGVLVLREFNEDSALGNGTFTFRLVFLDGNIPAGIFDDRPGPVR